MKEETAELFYPELSYRIVGILFQAQNELGDGYQEKHIQRALAVIFDKERIQFKQQVMIPIIIEDKIVGRYFLDFEIENKIILEIKVGEKLSKKDFDQVKQYLLRFNLQLGLLARFGRNGVKIYRILKPINSN